MQYLMKGIQVCENERPYPLSMGDNEELKKKLKIFYFYTNLDDKFSCF